LSTSVLKAVAGVGKKVDELRELLEDSLLSPQEHILLQEIDKIVEEKKLDELVPLGAVQGTASQKGS